MTVSRISSFITLMVKQRRQAKQFTQVEQILVICDIESETVRLYDNWGDFNHLITTVEDVRRHVFFLWCLVKVLRLQGWTSMSYPVNDYKVSHYLTYLVSPRYSNMSSIL